MRAMIVPLEPREFIPCGLQAYSHHPGLLCLHFHQGHNFGNAPKSLLGTLSQVTLDDKPKSEESWKLRIHKNVEEELFISGHTVIWSRGHVVLKSITVDTPVKQVVWCDFLVNSEDPYQFELPHVKAEDCESIRGVAVVADGTVHVFTEDGETYDTALPFQVRDAWNFKFGLLFERSRPPSLPSHNMSTAQSSVSENDLTTIFCLQHPLREFSPVITKAQGSVRYMNRSQDIVVYCEDDFVMTCDERHGLHTVWRARKVCSDDVNVLQTSRIQQNQISSICHNMSLSSPGVSPFRGSYRGSPGYTTGSAFMGGGNIPGLTKTPHNNRNPSLAHLSYTPHSSKAFSPSAGSLLFQSHTFSPLRHSPHLTRSPCTPVSHESLCLNNSVHETAEPLRPELCFDHMWTESVSSTREGLNIGRATKVFRTNDLCGQTYLVYHLDSLSQLRLVRYSPSNDLSHLIFGAVTCFQARDAVPLKNQSMLALLDLSGSITLYSGLLKVVKMNISGIPMASLSLSHGLRNTASVPATPQPISTPAHPSRPTSAMANLDEVGLLSPVPELCYSGEDIGIMTGDEFAFSTSAFSTKLTGLTHVVGSTILVELASGSHYKVEIPQLCTSDLVSTCMKALQYMLPNDAYLQFSIKWYSTRHAPGALNGRRAEWTLFVECLQEFLGYSGPHGLSVRPSRPTDSMEFDVSASPVIAAKKARPMDQSDIESKDWKYLLESNYENDNNANPEAKLEDSDDNLVLTHSQSYSLHRRRSIDSSLAGDTSHLTNQLLMSVFCALHLVYEEQKLCTLTWQNIEVMSSIVYRLASDLHQVNFIHAYAMDNPALYNKLLATRLQDNPALDDEFETKVPGYFSPDSKPSLFENLDHLMKHGCSNNPIPYIPGVTTRIERVFKIYDCLFNKTTSPSTLVLAPLMKTTFNAAAGDVSSEGDKLLKMPYKSSAEKVLAYMVAVDIDNAELMTWPAGVSLAVQDSLRKCCDNPDLTLPAAALKLLGRGDLVAQMLPGAGEWREAGLCPSTDPLRFAWTDENNETSNKDNIKVNEILSVLEEDDNEEDISSKSHGTDLLEDNVTRLLFPNDHRMADAHNLLDSSKPSKITLIQEAGVDDREFMEQKEVRLQQLLNRSMALSVGRGMLTYRTQIPSGVEPVKIPNLEFTGKDTSNGTVNLLTNSSIEIPPETTDWPIFHNGVAASLAIQPDENNMSWVHLNKQTNDTTTRETVYEPSFKHAGALFGLGLNHHLQELQTLNVHDYLQKSHEMTTIGLLLGLASDKCGSCDLATMRVLSVHISALLPATSTQLDIPYRVQTAAVMAVGFLYLGSAQRLVAEVMLREIDRSPAPETEISVEREAYSLSAGFALGMVTLGKGDRLLELSDLNISDKLYHFMTGRHKRRTAASRFQDIYSPGHSAHGNNFNQILEGDRVNTEVTCPGATIALALMFLKTNNNAVADWFIAPDTISLLETIKPQHLMLRTMSRALILWDQIIPSVDWVESHIPFVICSHLNDSGMLQVDHNATDDTSQVDEHTILQCHASIITGACIALGLRYAGSQEKTAYDTLLHYVNFFLSLSKQPGPNRPSHPLEVIGHRLFETCLTSCLLSMCMVVAGSGNLKALQICRYLHHSVETEVNYGMQMAMHMALGFLFLGGCRYTLGTSNKAIAALLVSIYPSFPVKSFDNRYHLQAFRHMYIMAAEKRLLVPIDVSTQRPCYARVSLTYLPRWKYSDVATVKMMAPCMLPEICFLQSISVDDERHLPMQINVDKQPDKAYQLIKDGMYVQLRPGCLPYIQDPKGHCTFLSRSWKHKQVTSNHPKHGIHSDQLVNLLFATTQSGESTTGMSHIISLLNEHRNYGKTFFLYLSLLQMCLHIESGLAPPDPLSAWQIRLADDFISQSEDQCDDISMKLMQAMTIQLNQTFDKFVSDNKTLIQLVLHNRRTDRIHTRSQSYHDKDQSAMDNYKLTELQFLSCYLIYNRISLPPTGSNKPTASPSKRRSRQKPEEQLTSALLRFKQLTDLELPTSAALQICSLP